MGKSLRSKTKLKYRNERRHTIYEAEEDARRQRLAAKLMGQVKEVAKEEKKAARAGASDDVEIVDKDTQEKGDENKDEGKFLNFIERNVG